MAEIKWIKIVTDIFDNRKIKQIESLPDGDTIIVIWFKLLCLAGVINDNGSIYITQEIPYTEETLATQFNRPLATIQLAMKTFQAFGMIEVINDVLHISNWENYQNIEGMEKIREQTRKRVAKHRKNQRLKLKSGNANVTLHVTQSNATDKNRKDKKRKEEIEVRNNAESLVYNSQKTLDELGDKVSGEEKAKVEAEVENVRKSLEGTSVDAIKEATEKLTKVFYELSEKLYSAQAAQGAGTAEAASDNGEAKEGTVYDADYKVEEDGNDDNK